VTNHREPRNPGRTVRNAIDGQEHPAWGGVARQRGAARWPVEGQRGALVGPAPGGIKSERKGPSGSQPPPRAIGPQPDALAAPRSPMGDGQCGRRRGGQEEETGGKERRALGRRGFGPHGPRQDDGSYGDSGEGLAGDFQPTAATRLRQPPCRGRLQKARSASSLPVFGAHHPRPQCLQKK